MTLKITLLAAALAVAGMATAQESSEKYDAKSEMQQQMRTIVNGLKLEPVRVGELGQIMEEKRKKKEELLNEIDKIKGQMISLEENKQKQIQAMLTAEEWAKYQKDIKPQIDENFKKRMDKIEE